MNVFPIVLDNPELVMVCFSFMEAASPDIKSTNMRNNTAKIVLETGAKNAIVRIIIF
jgi:hypothetical protein